MPLNYKQKSIVLNLVELN